MSLRAAPPPALEAVLRLERPGWVLDARFRLAGPAPVHPVQGPTGAGKSSLLRALAGLEPGVRGLLRWGGRPWLDGAGGLPAHRRPVALALQEAPLFPHWDVARNLAYGWRRRGRGRPGLPTPEQAAAALGLEGLLGRRADRLSVGQRRLAHLARAVLSGPELLLLDEPTAGLDGAVARRALAWVGAVAAACGMRVLCALHEPGPLREALPPSLVGPGLKVESGAVEAGRARPLPPVPMAVTGAPVLAAGSGTWTSRAVSARGA